MSTWPLLMITAAAAAGVEYRTLRHSYFLELRIGAKQCAVDAYGAVGDGVHNDTAAIQAAIDDCGENGGGTVLLPRRVSGQPADATYLAGALRLRHDHIELNVADGATLRISNNRSAWPEGEHFISAREVQHVAVTGGGTIDGQGAVWWAHRDEWRPHTVDFSHVDYGMVSGVTIRDPPNHCLELGCDHCEVAGVSIFAPPSTGTDKPSHNTDAIDVHGTPFYVHDCHFDTGDDNIAAHANHTLVEDCHFGHGHGASIGSLCDSWLHNITFRNISFVNTTAGARIKVHPNCDGRVWDVTYEDLTMEGVQTPIDLTMFYGEGGDAAVEGAGGASGELGGGVGPTAAAAAGRAGGGGFVIEDVSFKRIRSSNSHYEGSSLCTTDQPCRGLTFEDVHFDVDQWRCHGGKGCECFTATTESTASGVVPDIGSCIK